MATWVLLRGLMRDHRHWQGFEHRLKEQGLAVITPDLPGNGELAHEVSPAHMRDYADAVWRQLGQANDLHLVGLSMGGMLALEMARQAPERIARVFLLNCSAANLSPWYQRFSPMGLLKACIGCRKSLHLNLLESLIIKLTSYRHGRDFGLISQWSDLRRVNHTRWRNLLRQVWAAAHFRAPAAIGVPLVLIYGREDRLVNPVCSYRLARFYRLDVSELPHCGHDIALDNPEALLALLLDRRRSP
ncbi:alpha/beta hydrolase [Shewanella sp. AS16]|uniref:alpha/beta fold hydrolase n=1 Tax=Shewanella sp. AS16 TaxID=2907625 RepID=UPI001F326458|nr:alpha/beta hydrolase [Shewanella sp. AS16]MCE9688234.1 alpha/beta hydrolase [Shewanella sp. AS16]